MVDLASERRSRVTGTIYRTQFGNQIDNSIEFLSFFFFEIKTIFTRITAVSLSHKADLVEAVFLNFWL